MYLLATHMPFKTSAPEQPPTKPVMTVQIRLVYRSQRGRTLTRSKDGDKNDFCVDTGLKVTQ